MRVLLLSDTYSEHTEKWALGLASIGVEVGLFSFNKASYNWFENKNNIHLLFQPSEEINPNSGFTKISYISHLRLLKKKIKRFKPDILHAHYATSYGLVGALSGFKPFVLSVWGSDVYEFPKKTLLHKKIFQFNLKKAAVILSTSHVMKNEVKLYTDKEVYVTPFGIDTDLFKPLNSFKKDDIIRIGTIKPIEEKYGISDIIEAARLLIAKYPEKNFRFYLIGPSYNISYYTSLMEEKKVSAYFEITGRIPFSEIQQYHNLLDVFLNVSVDDSESFGVAAVEAMACEKPVIVTDVGGLMEVVDNGKFGLIVPKKNPAAIVAAIEKIINKAFNVNDFCKNARKHAVQNYNWDVNLNQMFNIYSDLLKK